MDISELAIKECTRKYVFADRDITFHNVTRFKELPNGRHQIFTLDGAVSYVQSTWLYIVTVPFVEE